MLDAIDLARNGKSIADIVREYFPEVDDEDIDFIVWDNTGWPAFWSTPCTDDGPEDCFRHDVARMKWDLDNCQPIGAERAERMMRGPYPLTSADVLDD